MKPPTVYDVAEAAGVSTATVSFTFRRPERVKDSTRRAVLEAARHLGYVPSASARGLAAGRTGAIGLVTWDLLAGGPRATADLSELGAPDDDDALRLFPRYVDEVQHGVQQAAWRLGYALLVGGGNHADSTASIIDIAGRVDGLVVLPHTIDDDTILAISRKIPVVVLSRGSDPTVASAISVDNAGGMHDLLTHLIDVHCAQRLEFYATVDSVDCHLRFEAMREELTARGLPTPAVPLPTAASVDGLVDHLLAEGLPQGIVCGTDPDALDLLDAFRRRGVRVPEDVLVTGFDGIAASRVSRPALTTVRQPMHEMGAAAVELVVDQLSGERGEGPPLQKRFAVRTVVRESCGCRDRRGLPPGK